MDKINFPINFNPIGLNYTMTYAHFGDSNDVAYLRQQCQEAIQDTIQIYGSELIRGGKLRVQNDHYRIVRSLASGSYGTTAMVQNSKDGLYYCLKSQVPQSNHDELECYKEAMMHHILDLHTRSFMDHKSDLIPTLYHVIRSKIVRGPIYFIMDLMSESLSSRLDAIPSGHGRILEFVRCLTHITPTLTKLYTNGLYNHGDLHMGNIMYDRLSGMYRLIDYGFSRIRIGTGTKHHMLALAVRNKRSDASRDLTQLIVNFEMRYRINKMEYTEGSFEHAVQQMIQRVVYNGRCSGLHPEHSYDFIDYDWRSSYAYFNDHTNLNGTHWMIQSYINSLPSPNVASSSVRTPHAASASSHAASASSHAASASSRPVRTPRPASAAPRANEIVPIKRNMMQNPGCIILIMSILGILLGKVFAMQFKGGRVANPSISLVQLPHHVSYSKNHSIQMKPPFKNLSNTRTKRSVKNSTRRRSYTIPQAKIEDFDKLSIVSFYHFLRFQAFPKQKEKKEMFKIAAMVPLQRPDVFSQIVIAVKENDMDHMMEILQRNKLPLTGIEPYQERWNTILDAYFAEKDSPFELLQTLLHVGDQVADFMKRYHSADKETKNMMVMQTCITASDAPELMLE